MAKAEKEREKMLKVMLTLLAALLTFAGPTYLIYILRKIGIPHLLLVLLGLASFTAGIILFMRLTKEKS